MRSRPLVVLAALAAAAEPDFGREALDRLKSAMRRRYAEDPIDATVTTALVASWLFYRAERGKNPRVNSFYDALVCVASNLAADQNDVFAQTSAGKLIGSALLTFGPAMGMRVLDDPRSADAPDTSAVVERLDRILEALERRVTLE
jgi:hypothetical protein